MLSGFTGAAAGEFPLHTVARFPLPGPNNRFDYLSIDSTRGELYIAHMDAGQLLVFDRRHRRVVATVPAPGVHGVIAVPQLRRVFATATDAHELLTIDTRRLYVAAESGDVAVFAERGRSLAKLGHAKVSDEAHSIAVDPRTQLVYFPLESGSSGRPSLLIMRPS